MSIFSNDADKAMIIASKLIMNGSDPDILNNEGWGALHIAIKK